jgi:hypothetical protein
VSLAEYFNSSTPWKASTEATNDNYPGYADQLEIIVDILRRLGYVIMISSSSPRITDYARPNSTGFVKMPSRDRPSVDVTIPVEPEAAAALVDPRNREAVGRLISRVLRRRAGPSPLAEAIAELKAEARAAGLTDADIDAELAACNTERPRVAELPTHDVPWDGSISLRREDMYGDDGR